MIGQRGKDWKAETRERCLGNGRGVADRGVQMQCCLLLAWSRVSVECGATIILQTGEHLKWLHTDASLLAHSVALVVCGCGKM